MNSFAEFESAFLSALHQERSDLQGLQSASEAQVSAWIEHLFREYLGYTHWKEITREGSSPVGSKGSKQLFPDLRIDVLDNGLIFVECKRLGRLDGAKGQEELEDAALQLKTYIRAHIEKATVEKATVKPKTVLGVASDGNHWLLLGLNRTNDFHIIAKWAFLTDDPRIIAQRLWLLAKPALAQPTSALIQFLARRTLVDVLKDMTHNVTKKVNEKLPEGSVSEDLIGRWLRDALADTALPPHLVSADAASSPVPASTQQSFPTRVEVMPQDPHEGLSEPTGKKVSLNDLLGSGLLLPQDQLMVKGPEGRQQTATVTTEGKINVAGQLFDTVSPAALRALELAGKVLKAVNGWATFRVMRSSHYMGTLLEIRGQYEDKEHEASTVGSPQQPASPSLEGQDTFVQSAVEQMKQLLALLPELTVKTSKSTISLYGGKLVVGYAYPRKTAAPRLRAFVGEKCPEWGTPDSTYSSWCYIDDWTTKLDRVAALFKEAPQRRAEDLAAGRDAYRRRLQPANVLASHQPE